MYQCTSKECRAIGVMRFSTGGLCPCGAPLQEEVKDIERDHDYILCYPELVNRGNKMTHEQWCKDDERDCCNISPIICDQCKIIFDAGIQFGKLD